MLEVRVKDNESLNRALKRFTDKCRKERIQPEIKKRLRYEKPSDRRRRKIKDSKRRNNNRRYRR